MKKLKSISQLRTNYIDSTFLLISIIFFSIFCIAVPVEPLFSTINYMLGVFCLAAIGVHQRNPYDLRQLFLMACFILLGLAARLDKSYDLLFWNAPQSVLSRYTEASLYCLVGLFSFTAAYKFCENRAIVLTHKSVTRESTYFIRVSFWPLLMLSVASAALIFYRNDWNFESVMLRGGELATREFNSQLDFLLFQTVLYPIPSICLALYLQSVRKSLFGLTVLAIIFVIANPATGMARWQAGMLYCAVAINAAPALLNTRLILVLGAFGGLFLVFPLLDAFRYFNDDTSIKIASDWIFQGHLDSAQSIARAIDLGYISYGWQLLGALLFFVPRTWWEEKPVGSGHETSALGNLDLSNIAMNYFGEGYINFGPPGILIFGIFAGYIFSKLDVAFWVRENCYSYLRTLYPFLAGWIFFFVRGDLMSSIAYMTGTASVIYIIYKISNIFTENNLSVNI